MPNFNLNDIEKFIDDKLNSKFTFLEKIVDEKIKSKFSLSIKYWYPTLITVMIATIGGVVWFHNQLKPIQDDVTILKNGNSSKIFSTENPVVDMKYLLNISVEHEFSKVELKTLNDLIYKMKNERKDLVLIIAGYTKDDKTALVKDEIIKSDTIARKIADFFVENGIERERVFYKGHGPNVPGYFDKKGPLNTCLMLCDLFTLMKKVAA